MLLISPASQVRPVFASLTTVSISDIFDQTFNSTRYLSWDPGMRTSPTLAVDPVVADLLKTTTSRLCELMVKDIVKGVYAPGDRLRIAEIANRYGISHMPVREALRQLEGDKVVQITLRRGAIVRPVDKKFVQDLHELRSSIEVLLVRKCVQNISESDLDQLRILEQRFEVAATSGDTTEILEANKHFHNFIYLVADNTQAALLINEGWPLINAMRVKFGYGQTRLSEVVAEHKALVRAICDRDLSEAVNVATAHCERAVHSLLTRM